jgi:GT2 family glycosyltransferase
MKQPRRVSIVIVTHNNLMYAQECLAAVQATAGGHRIVVVDNASTDGTREFLAQLEQEDPSVSVQFNRTNVGFAAGCNQGVALSRHGTICLLSSEAVPFQGWLDAMLEVLGPDVGAVGSKLLLPDMTLEHCGLEFAYGEEPVAHFWPYRRYVGQPASIPEANVLEEVPAVAGACLLTTKKVWDRVGGMDEGYLAASFEDVDFSLAVRDAGFKVLYQPASQLVHYWDTTSETKDKEDADSSAHDFQRDFSRLMERWFAKLSEGLHAVGPRPMGRRTEGERSAGLHVVFMLLSFRFLTGSELYVYELCRELRERGHKVTVIAQSGGEVDARAGALGVEVFDYRRAPYSTIRPDILHVSQREPASLALRMFPGVPVVATVHSQYDVESPLVDPRVATYICVRPEVMEHVVAEHGVSPERCEVIYNPIDLSRFRPHAGEPRDRPLVVFVGTVDRLRRPTILHLIERSKAEGFDLRIVGPRYEDYLDSVFFPHVQVKEPVWDIERYLCDADQTAGILLGRTTIEGWACGKPGWIYKVDERGEILSYDLHRPPKDMTPFDSRLVADRILAVYDSALRE